MEGVVDASISNLGVNDDNDESVDETEEDSEPRSNNIDSSNKMAGTKTDLYMLSVITA